MDYIFNPVSGKSFKEDLKLLSPGGRIFCYGGASRSGKKNHLLNDLAFLLKTGFVSPLFLMMKCQGVIGVNILRIANSKLELLANVSIFCCNWWRMGRFSQKLVPPSMQRT